jgi:Tol biopolymer transport system component
MTSGKEWPLGRGRRLRRGQRTEIWIAGADGGPAQLVFTSHTILLEAPNWTPDGRSLLLNGDGLLWRLGLDATGRLHQVRLDGVPPLNNDHVVDGARGLIYLSANDGHIWVAPVGGGLASRITDDDSRYHFLHGVSPDGMWMAFVELPAGDSSAAGRLGVIPARGGPTRYPEAGTRHLDGPEYSPDGAWLYLNTEEFGTEPGHAQLARVPSRGGRLEQLVSSDTVDWFPHLSPDGRFASYLSFPRGTLGHPADLDVRVRLVRTCDWANPIATYSVFGGQGTVNVNSWSPDSRHFAFVAYPVNQTMGHRTTHAVT